MLFVGEGPNRAEYEEMVKNLHMENEIFFTGGIANEKLPDYYRAADLFLFASKTETQGIVIIETMAAETPVIAVKATGVSDIVKDGINGYLTREDVSDFAKHIELVMTRPSLLKELEKNAFETAYLYSQAKVARRAAFMYQSIIDTNCKETEISIIKYAMEGAREYLDVYEHEDKVEVILKNISSTELTVNPAELTERFVRGDA